MININDLFDIDHLIFEGQLTSPFCHVSLTMFLYPHTFRLLCLFSTLRHQTCPFRKRDCVSALGSICFHILLSYYGLIGLLTALFASLCCWHLSAIPCYWETARPPRYAISTLTSRPSFKRRRCLAILALTNGLCWLRPK